MKGKVTLEFSSRLVNAFVPNANVHIGWHWDPAALARWTSLETVVSFSLEAGDAAQENLAGGRHLMPSSFSFDKGNVGNVITLVAGDGSFRKSSGSQDKVNGFGSLE